MASPAEKIEKTFPKLKRGEYSITSPEDSAYNCIAWVAQDTQRWWWPDKSNPFIYWPLGVPRELTLEAFIQAFKKLGFTPCDSFQLEKGFEKIAIYSDPQGTPKHAARQLSNGKWTSKIGPLEDIEHKLKGLENSNYGSVAQIMKRKIMTS